MRGKEVCHNDNGEMVMSTHEEIWEVYAAEIGEKSAQVYRNQGAGPFYEGFAGLTKGWLWPGELIDICEAAKKADRDNDPAS